jgi:acetolactate synthase-1/2/3 large subunit
VDVALVGDAKVVLGQLVQAVKAIAPARKPGAVVAELQATRDAWRGELSALASDMERSPMLTGVIWEVLNGFAPEDAIVTLDGGNTTMWSMNYLVARRERSVLYTHNMGYLGTGLPFAIGAALAAPGRFVCCVTGDGAFGFNIQELETAARLRLPIVVIVAVDGAFGMEKTAQRRVFGREAPWFHHEHAPVRYDEVARAMGCHGEYVERGSEVRPALERAAASGRPAVIHAVVDAEANVDPPGMWIWNTARSGRLVPPA